MVHISQINLEWVFSILVSTTLFSCRRRSANGLWWYSACLLNVGTNGFIALGFYSSIGAWLCYLRIRAGSEVLVPVVSVPDSLRLANRGSSCLSWPYGHKYCQFQLDTGINMSQSDEAMPLQAVANMRMRCTLARHSNSSAGLRSNVLLVFSYVYHPINNVTDGLFSC